MKVYRKNSQGFIEELNTVGSYVPKGWSRSWAAANRKKGKKENPPIWLGTTQSPFTVLNKTK